VTDLVESESGLEELHHVVHFPRRSSKWHAMFRVALATPQIASSTLFCALEFRSPLSLAQPEPYHLSAILPVFQIL